MELCVQVKKTFPSGFRLAASFMVNGPRLGIFGESGGGKSTLIALLSGLEQPDEGEITLNGTTLFSSSRGINLPPDRRRVGMVFQHACLFPHLSVQGNLLYGWRRCRPEDRCVDPREAAAILKIDHLLTRSVDGLSGGERQRVALGRALLASPRLLLMDEPLSALDDTLRFQIIPYLRGACETFGIPYLFISHSLVEMRLMSERVVVLESGRQTSDTDVDNLARMRMGASPVGYINLLNLTDPQVRDSLASYAWGAQRLYLSAGPNGNPAAGIFELSSKDIILFKQHPQAISARNLLACTVRGLFESGAKVGVDLECGGQSLVAEIVPSAAHELEIVAGTRLYAAVKASAFRRLSAATGLEGDMTP